ncbi:MAG: double zinc ribbon domain-containing protein, partial [bacterium]|nr:double zinc ribbon domain-containing protein [bacterium]
MLYPSRCVACGRPYDDFLCERCQAQLTPNLPPACPRCGAPMRELGDCRACLNSDYAFDWAVCGGLYMGSVRRAVINLKFRRWRRAAEPLARLLWEAFQYPAHAPLRQADAIVPVPIHPYRRAMRGFNQTELIGQRLSHLSTVPMQTHW